MRRKTIPTILGIVLTLVLIVGVALATKAVQKVTQFFSSAASLAPSGPVGVANLTDTSLAIFWTTDKESSSVLAYGKSSDLSEGLAVDDRDLTSPNGKYLTHFVRLGNLKPSTRYYFKAGAGPIVDAQTTPPLPPPPVVEPIYGQVLDPTGSPVAGAIVVWESSGATKIATLSKTDGNFVLPLGNARTSALQSYFLFTPGLPETVTIDAGPVGRATITCKFGQDKPLPTVKLGDSLDCASKTITPAQKTTATVPLPPAPAGGSGFKAPRTGFVASGAGQLQVNLTDGESVPSQLPTFSGKAGPNQIVKIEVHTDATYSGIVKADPAGFWSWTPPANLSPGQHTVTITIINPDGTTQTVTRTFYVGIGVPLLPITSGTPSAQPPIATPAPAPKPPPKTGSLTDSWILLTAGVLFATLGVGVILLSRKFVFYGP